MMGPLQPPLDSQHPIYFHLIDHLRNRQPPSLRSTDSIDSTVCRVSPCHQFNNCIPNTLLREYVCLFLPREEVAAKELLMVNPS